MCVLDYQHVLLAFGFVLLTIAVSLMLKLKQERNILFSVLRCILQLTLLGYFLSWLFGQKGILFFLIAFLFMVVAASYFSQSRIQRKYKGIARNTFVSILVSSGVTGIFTLFWAIPQEPWFQLSTAVPLIGMLLGNSLTGISLALDRFLSEISLNRNRVESLLALGASRYEACRLEIKDSIQCGLTPITNSMMIVGIVSIPGMMTGQILAGGTPWSAAIYQMVILLMITCSTFFSIVFVVFLTFKHFMNQHHQIDTSVFLPIQVSR